MQEAQSVIPGYLKEAKELLTTGSISTTINEETKINISLQHLRLAIKIKGERRAVIEHRKFYSGYLKGLPNVSKVRQALMQEMEYDYVEKILLNYLDELLNYKMAI